MFLKLVFLPIFLRAGLLGEPWSDGGTISAVWQDHVITEEAETGDAVESTIRLPAQASSFVTVSLSSICVEIARAGGPNLGRAIISRLASEYRGAVVASYSNLLDGLVESGRTLPQASYVQLMFDFNFISDVLAGAASEEQGVPVPDDARVEATRQRLTGLVDPFDLDVFAPFLREGRARLYQRTALLLGYFAQLRPLHAGARTAPSATDRHNLLAVCNTAPRMALLPVAGVGDDGMAWFGDSPALVDTASGADKLDVVRALSRLSISSP